MSESAIYRHLTVPYCYGNGIDIASQGDPIVPWAIQFELTAEKFSWYTSGATLPDTVEWRSDTAALDLPFKDATLDFLYSSHFIEDVFDWAPLLLEWTRVLKVGGHMVILLPDKERWAEALAHGQPPNNQHRHESFPGDLTEHVQRLKLPLRVLEDRLTECHEGDYTILFVGRKI